MNALLIYPEFPGGFWSFKDALPFIGCKALLQPLGLLTLALPKEWNVKLIDMNVERLTDAHVQWADCVLVSAMVTQRKAAQEVIARVAGIKKIPIIAGGPLFEEFEKFEAVDHIILGEAEDIFPCFLADFQKGCAKHIYRAPGYADITTASVPRWDLIGRNMRKYASQAVQFTRGCPKNCDFCDIAVRLGRRPRLKTSKQMIAELDALRDAGWRGEVFFVDDNFIGNKRALKEDLLPALIAWQSSRRWPFSFYTEASIDLSDDDELMRLMVEAGFHQVFLGIETPSEEGLLECNKLQNIRRNLMESIGKIQDAGLEVQGGFIVGLNSDDPATCFRRMFDFIQKSGIPTAMVGILQAFPGTRLYERLLAEGRIKGEITGSNDDGTTNVVTKMSQEDLSAGYKWLTHELYAPENYYRRVRVLLEKYNPGHLKAPLDLRHFLAVGRSILFLGILGEERCEWWKLVAWVLRHRPRLFPVALKHAVLGYHFRRVYQRIN